MNILDHYESFLADPGDIRRAEQFNGAKIMKPKTSGLLIIISLLLMPLSTVWSGYVLAILWKWFIVPAFGAHELRIPFAIGISLVASYLTYQHIDCEEKDNSANEKILNGIIAVIMKPTLSLLIGWIVQKFI